MPTAPIPFTPTQASGLEAIAGQGVVAMNVVMEASGTVRKRPGLRRWAASDLAGGDISGLHETVSGAVYAVVDSVPIRKLYRVMPGAQVDLSPTALEGLDGTRRPTFAETQPLLVIAAGGAPQKIELAANASSRLGGSPPTASHVIANASRLLLNDLVTLKGSAYYSAVQTGPLFTNFEVWSAATNSDSGVFSAESRPDGVVAIGEAINEVFLWGPTTVQTFQPSGSTVYSVVMTAEAGTLSPYSIVRVDDSFVWFDQKRRFVVSDARQVVPISDPIQTTLDALTTIDDCFGYRVHTGGVDLALWTFPTDGRTFVYQKGVGWGQWAGGLGAPWTTFPVTALTELKDEGGILVGTTAGTLAKLEFGVDDLGAPIRAFVETGHLNRGTDSLKLCKAIRISMRRENLSADTEPVALLSWRDNLGPWEEPLEVGFGSDEDQETVVSFYGLGAYRRRQWRFEFSGDVDLSLVSVTEDYQVQE